MKKIIALVFLISITTNNVNGQEKKFGVLAGANYATWTGDVRDFVEVDRRLGVRFGFYADLGVARSLTISPRILYSSYGYSNDSANRDVLDPQQLSFRISNRYNYLIIPISLKLGIANNISINLGPQVGFLLNTASVLKDIDGNLEIEQGRTSSSGDFKLDYGGILGVSYNLTQDFFLELYYYQGFSNISRPFPPDFSNNNSVLQFSVGYHLF